jgi:hypothetical protein
MQKPTKKEAPRTKPKFPYTTTPSALRKFLQEAPKRPKPTKIDFALLQTWGIKDNNARTIISVIKSLGLVDGAGTPTEHYAAFMRNDTGAASLASQIKQVYSQLFETSLEPYKDTHENLENFFNIHSGGGERAIQYQVQTFKTLCEHADFTSTITLPPPTPGSSGQGTFSQPEPEGTPHIHVNLHIHLPENKSRSD